MRLPGSGVGRALLVIALVAVAVFAFAPTVEHKVLGKAAPGVTTIHDISQFAAAFNQDAGAPRLVVIFSPT
jgi:hypothetical protein